MQASFSVITADGLTLHERQIAAEFDNLRPDLAGLDGLEGLVTLYNDTGSYRVTALRDVLGPLVTQLCVHVVTELAAGRDVTVTLFAYDERVQFRLEGDEVDISGDDLEGDRCPRASLLTALVECGERFHALLQRVCAADPDWAENRDAWQEAVTRARACLA